MDQATKNAVLEMFQQLISSVPSSSQTHHSPGGPGSSNGSAPTAAVAAASDDLRSRLGDLDAHESDGNSSVVLDAAPPLATYTAEDYLSKKHNQAKKIFKVGDLNEAVFIIYYIPTIE